MRYDPVERTRKYRMVVDKVDEQARAAVIAIGLDPDGMGACHTFWPAKKAILREMFGIEWRSPAEMNPEILFD